MAAPVWAGTTFTPGSVVVNQSGNGSTLGSGSFPVSLVEYNTGTGAATGTVVALPTSSTANSGGLTDGGSSGTQGELNLSVNGQYLTLSGYDAPVGIASITSSTAGTGTGQYQRNVAQVDSSGNIIMVAELPNAFSGNNTRAPLTDKGASGGYYLAGNGNFYWINTASGTPTTVDTSIYTTQNLENGQFAADSAWNKYVMLCSAKTAPWISYYAAPFPTASATPTTVFGGTTLSGPTGFAFLDVDGNVSTGGIGGLDTVYIADGTIKKYVWNSGTSAWTAAGSTSGSYACLAARVVGTNVEIYATTTVGSANSLVKIVDSSGYGGTLSASATTLATAATNYAFRGVAFSPSPALFASTGTLAALSTPQGVASSTTSFSLSASSGLTGNVTVTAPAGFQVSTSSSSGFASSITLTPSSGSLAATTIYVILPASDAVGSYSGNVVCSGGGSAALYVPTATSAVTGSVPTVTLSGTASALSTVYGTASTPLAISAAGTNLTGNVTVTAPAGFEISTSSSTGYGGNVILTQSGGTVASTPVYVRLKAADTVGSYSGNVSATSSGATTQTLAIPASAVSQLGLTVSGAAVTTKPYDGTNAANITGTLTGVLAGDSSNVALVGTGTFAQIGVGTGIAVTSTSTLSGSAAANYSLTQPTGLTGAITASDNLGGLTLGSGSLSPAFAFGTTAYAANVSATTTSISLTPAIGSGATVTVNGAPATSGNASIVNLNAGNTTITISVTQGGTTQNYSVVVTRMLPFTAGNLVIESIANSTATTLTMYELAPGAANANQTPVQTYVVPSTGANALRQSNAGTTARLGTTNNGTLMAFTGFQDSTGILGGSPVTDETSIAQRAVATLDANYNYVLQASYTSTTASGDQVRTATSLDNATWYLDDKSGIYLNGSTSPANGTNCVVVKSFGGTIYALSQKTTAMLNTLTGGGATLTALPGLPADANAVDYYLLSSGTQGNVFDILYVLDGNTVSKFSYSVSNTTWTQNGAATSIGGLTGIGMCAIGNGGGAILYITTELSDGSAGNVLQITDTAGYGAAPNINTNDNITLYNSTAFLKGISFAPLASALPDLTIGVSSPFISGSNSFSYTLTLSNSGTVSASGVTAQFALPTGVNYSSYTYSGGHGFTASQSGGVVSISGGTLAASSSDTITINVTAANGSYIVDPGSSPATGHGFVVINPTGAIAESNLGNNYQNIAVPTLVGSVPYLTVNVSGASTVAANGNYTYVVTAQNTGSATATGINIQFTLPAGLTYVSAVDGSGDGFTGSYNASTGVLTLSGGSIAAGASDNITVTVSATTSVYRIDTEYVNPGAVVITGSNFSGSNSSAATVSTSVTLPTGPDLVIACTPNGPFQAGDAADTFNIYITNNGTAPTSGTVTVTETLPAGLTPASSMNGQTVNGWTMAVSGQVVTATRSDVLQAGAEYPAVATGPNIYGTLPITFSVGSSVSGALSATATVSGGGDVFSYDNSVTNTITAGAPTAISSSGYLLVSRGHYQASAVNITPGVTALPNGALATVSGAYPQVWTNETPDVSFGVTAPIYLDVVSKNTSTPVASANIPAANSTNLTALAQSQLGTGVTTSFSSKSEMGLQLTPNGQGVTFMGYMAPVGTLDVSNANTPYHDDPTSPLAGHGDYQHCVIQVDYQGNVKVTPTDSNSGDNTRTAVLAQASDGNSYYYFAGSAGNSGGGVTGTTMTMLAQGTGIQMILPGAGGITTPVGQPFGAPNASTGYQLGYPGLPGDKTGKDMNLRGLVLNPFNNTLYASKGSGGNGVDTIYQIGSGGLPTAANANTQVFTVPAGLPSTNPTNMYPFGMWFANATTLYVGDEGEVPPSPPTFTNGSGGGYTGGYYPEALTANGNSGGLQKWVYNGSQWTLAYTLTKGLNLGVPYSYTISGYPAPGTINSSTGVYWQPANNGLRNIAGQVNGDGTVTIFAVTATVSGDGDQGADPNQLVVITDNLSATSLPSSESFTVLETASGPDTLRGVSLAPAPAAPDLGVTATHTGAFTQGDTSDTCTVTVMNPGNASTTGTVTVVDTFPTGLTPLASNNGTINGWLVSVSGQTVTATRSDTLAQASAYATLPITVSVSASAPFSVSNSITVSGGGEVYTGNDTAVDSIGIVPAAAPYNSWKTTYFSTTSSTGVYADTASYSGDGISNLMKYGLGLNPTQNYTPAALPALLSNSSNPQLSGRLAMNFTLPFPAPTDVNYAVQVSSDLVNWTTLATKAGTSGWVWVAGGTSYVFDTDGSSTSSVQVGDSVTSSGNAPRFMRLQVSGP